MSCHIYHIRNDFVNEGTFKSIRHINGGFIFTAAPANGEEYEAAAKMATVGRLQESAPG